MTGFTKEKAEKLLREVFAPWVQELDLRIEELREDGALVRVPFSDRLCREGGVLCGQAMAAVADTAMVFAVSSASGGYRPMTTVDLSISLMRPVQNADLICNVQILRMGRSMAFGLATLMADGDARPVGSASVTFALLGGPAEG
jgi:uncharacterized protein (TIGR00369 family)